ncbi:MAG: DUF1127 domain-containing protein [Gammaproteobacteria bacterium]|nr:DUF1127 domain-containing protein [Gammaproteobacteria bacterium]
MTTVRLHHFVDDNDISSSVYGLVQRIEAAVKDVRETLSTWASRSEDRRQLGLMSDHLLNDIGLSRAAVAVEVNKYFWQR